MWGIAPTEPGYARATIKPQLSGLSLSKISVPTIRGNIEAEFNLTKGGKEYIINIPGNMGCDFVISDKGDFVVLLNNKQFDAGTGRIKLKQGLNRIEIMFVN